MIQDHEVEWMRTRRFYGPMELNGLVEAAGVLAEVTDTTVLPIIVTGLRAVGLTVPTGKAVAGYFHLPTDVDPKFDLGFKTCWTADVTSGTAGVTWTMVLDSIKSGIALVDATTVMDTVFGAQTYLPAANVDNVVQWGSRAIRTSKTLALSRTDIEASVLMPFKLTSGTFVAVTTLFFLGLLMDYVPQRCVGVGSEMDRSLNSLGS